MFRVSRESLFQTLPQKDKNDADIQTDELLKPDIEIVEVEVINDKELTTDESQVDAGFEFFPLFSTGELTKVDLSEPQEEVYELPSRPDDYYFAKYSEEEKLKFKYSALSFDQIVTTVSAFDAHKNRILDLNRHNDKIDKERVREKILKKRRPGKKQRLQWKVAKENIKKREEQDKIVRRLIKKKHHKRGGKKNKKKPVLNPLANAGANSAVAVL